MLMGSTAPGRSPGWYAGSDSRRSGAVTTGRRWWRVGEAASRRYPAARPGDQAVEGRRSTPATCRLRRRIKCRRTSAHECRSPGVVTSGSFEEVEDGPRGREHEAPPVDRS